MKQVAELADILGPAIVGALEQKGYATLTQVQQAVLDPALEGRDLRISSQTGSGKTLALGLVLRKLVELPREGEPTRSARPRAMVVTPTRELAKQVAQELRWLYAGFGVKVATATGGSSFRDEARGFAMDPAVIVGTPGRLLDCLKRDAIDASQVGAVVLDEADRMLDLGFREDLEAILACPPKDHRTHLVSATFARDVAGLANRVQRDAVSVEGTRLGAANADIDHVLYLIAPEQRLDALINLLLADPEAQTVVFVRMRRDVADVSRALKQAGFMAAGLSGEMEQRERNHTLSEFKRGYLRVLVATDVAARGIDIPDVTRVVHAEPPTDADGYTHRSGRTGRAGRKGQSALLVTTAQIVPVTRILRQGNIVHRFATIPTAAEIVAQSDARLLAALTRSDEQAPVNERLRTLAEQILATSEPLDAVTRLLARLPEEQRIAPRDVTQVLPPSPAKPKERARDSRDRHGRNERNERNERRHERSAPRERDARPQPAPAARDQRPSPTDRKRAPVQDTRAQSHGRKPPARAGRSAPATQDVEAWVPFRVTWGQEHGADARRLLAVVCRRGNIRGSDVGAIRIQRTFSVINVNADVAEQFERASSKADPRDPKIRIRPDMRQDD